MLKKLILKCIREILEIKINNIYVSGEIAPECLIF